MSEVRAGIYVRISDDPDDLQEGVTRQTEDCLDRAEELGWEVVETYRENNVSAWNGKLRPEYRRMTDDLLGGAVDAIVIWDVDRLLRQNLELELLLKAVSEKGGNRVADASGEYDLSNGDDQDRLRYKVMAASKESRDKSRRVKRAALQRARKGLPVHVNATKRRPFGYEHDFVTVRPDEARLLRDAAQDLLAGSDTLSGICRRWERDGVKTARGGDRWSYQALKSILTSPRIAGLVEHEREVLLDREGNPVEAQWQGILDESSWRELVMKLSDPSRRTNHVQGAGRRYLLTGGLGICGVCGERLTARPREGRRGDNRCYGCGRKRGCGIRQAAGSLEEFVRATVIEALAGGALTRLLRKQWGDEARERKLLEDLDRVNRALVQLDNDHYDGVLPRNRYLQQKARQEERRDKLSQSLATNGTTKVLAGLPGTSRATLEKAWDEHDLKWQRALVSAVVENVVVHPDKRRGQNGFDPARVELIWKV